MPQWLEALKPRARAFARAAIAPRIEYDSSDLHIVGAAVSGPRISHTQLGWKFSRAHSLNDLPDLHGVFNAHAVNCVRPQPQLGHCVEGRIQTPD